MIKKWFGKILLDLGDLEGEFRQFHLRDTINFYTIAAIAMAAANLAMLSIDTLFIDGNRVAFLWLLAFRSSYVAFTVGCLLLARRTTWYKTLDTYTFGWLLVTNIYFISFNFIRPGDYLTTNVDVLLVFGIYVLSSLRIDKVTLLTFTFSIGSLFVVYYYKTDVSIITRSILLWIHIFVQVIGLVSAIQIQTYRRRAFLAYSQEKKARELAHDMLRVDAMTQCLSRHHFLDLAEQEFERARRYSRPLSVLMMDIDHFKRINDRFGHHAGDQALKRFAEIVRREKRQSDLLGRLGGEEFALLLPETRVRDAEKVARRVQEIWSRTEIQVAGLIISSTVSIGVVESAGDDHLFEDVLMRSDQAMYRAKQGGRNRVEVGY